MPNKKDITRTGALTWKDLQILNATNPIEHSDIDALEENKKIYGNAAALQDYIYTSTRYEDEEEQSSILQNALRQGKKDYWGNSFWDEDIAVGSIEGSNLGDVRANNQWGIAKIGNGILKGGVTAVTTALETAGLIAGATAGLVGVARGGSWSEYLHGIWDNPITQALQKLNDISEEYLPNYYTQDEMENPWGHIFSANFLGDKLIKNFGFMVGAFYGGVPLSSALGAAGKAKVANTMARISREAQGAGIRVADIADDVAKSGLKGLAADAEVARRLSKAGLTEGEKAKKLLDGYNEIAKTARATKATTMAIGSLGSALNEGAIEALNNSRDWELQETNKENDRFNSIIEYIKNNVEDPETAQLALARAEESHRKILEEIQLGKAKMGNADLLLNIPILTISNAFELGHLYARGFDFNARRVKDFWGKPSALEGKLGNLSSSKTWKGGIIKGLSNANMEGTEEYLQRAASEGSGNVVSGNINNLLGIEDATSKSVEGYLQRYLNLGESEHAYTNGMEYIASFGKAIADQLDDPQAWEEYFIGALSSAIGMPVFGSQTKNAYAKIGNVGVAGGVFGGYHDYMEEKKQEDELAEWLNKRVKDPKFKALYANLRKQIDLDSYLSDALRNGDKQEYKDIEFDKLFEDINAAQASGHLSEFLQMIDYNDNITDEELNDIIKTTKVKVTAEEQKNRDINRLNAITEAKESLENLEDELSPEQKEELKAYNEEYNSINDRLNNPDYVYQDREESDFIDANGDMTITDESREKMREVLQKNRKKIRDTINNYLQIRNDIDIETDGRLSEKNLATLTYMRMKEFDYEVRSPEMAEDVARNMASVIDFVKRRVGDLDEDVAKAKKAYEEAPKDKKEQKEKEWKAAVRHKKNYDFFIKYLEVLANKKQTTPSEAADIERGYLGKKKSRLDAIKNFFNELISEETTDEETGGNNKFDFRHVNAEEAQSILRDESYAGSVIECIYDMHKSGELESSLAIRLMSEVRDLHILADLKLNYSKERRKFLGDMTLIDEENQKARNKLTQEQINNKAKDFALRMQEARNFLDLHNIIVEARQMDSRVAEEAFKQAIASADEETKKFLNEYDEGAKFSSDTFVQAAALPQGLREEVTSTLINRWNIALETADHLKQDYINGLYEDIELLKNKGATKQAEAIEKILNDLSAAKEDTTTNSDVAPTTNGSDTNVLKNLTSKDDIINNIKGRIKNAYSYSKGQFVGKIPTADLDFISGWNNQNPSDQITDDFIQGLVNEFVKETLAKERIEANDEGLELEGGTGTDGSYGSTRRDSMRKEINSSFVSDRVSEFQYPERGERDRTPKPFNPKENTIEEKIQDILKNYGAYDFVNKGFLGALLRGKSNLPLYFLKSTDTKATEANVEDAVFLAVKWSSDAEEYIIRQLYNDNERVSLDSGLIKKVTINGAEYVIVGTLQNLSGNEDVKNAYKKLNEKISSELDSQVEQAIKDGKSGEFFVSNSVTGEIGTIFTGRLRESTQKKGLKELLADYTDYTYGGNVVFGINIIKEGQTTGTFELPSSFDNYVAPNQALLNKKETNGAIFVMLRRPDGTHYPVRCTRRTLDEIPDFFKDNGKLDSYIDAYVKGNGGNKYFNAIFSLVKILTDSNADWLTKMNAKMMLHKFMLLGTDSPISFTSSLKLIIDGSETNISRATDSEEEVKEALKKFFMAFKGKNVKMSLPVNVAISGRDIVEADIFEIGISNIYNYNANFTIKATDGENAVSVTDTGTPLDDTPADSRPSTITLTYQGTEKEYIKNNDGTITYNGKEVTGDELEYIKRYLETVSSPTLFESELDNYIEELKSQKPLSEDEEKNIRSKASSATDIGKNLHVRINQDGTIDVYDDNLDSSKRFRQIDKTEYEEKQKEIRGAISSLIGAASLDDVLKGPINPSTEEEGGSEGPTVPEEPGTNNPGGTVGTGKYKGKTIDKVEGNIGKVLRDIYNIDSDLADSLLKLLQDTEGNHNLSEAEIIDRLTKIRKMAENEEDTEDLEKKLDTDLRCGKH